MQPSVTQRKGVRWALHGTEVVACNLMAQSPPFLSSLPLACGFTPLLYTGFTMTSGAPTILSKFQVKLRKCERFFQKPYEMISAYILWTISVCWKLGYMVSAWICCVVNCCEPPLCSRDSMFFRYLSCTTYRSSMCSSFLMQSHPYSYLPLCPSWRFWQCLALWLLVH